MKNITLKQWLQNYSDSGILVHVSHKIIPPHITKILIKNGAVSRWVKQSTKHTETPLSYLVNSTPEPKPEFSWREKGTHEDFVREMNKRFYDTKIDEFFLDGKEIK